MRGTYACGMPTQASSAVPRSPLQRWARYAGIRLGIALVAVVVLRLTGVVEGFAFYMPGKETGDAPLGIEDVSIPVAGSQSLHAWFIPATDSGKGEVRPAILHVHGNAGTVRDHLAFSQHLADAGFHVLLFDYRGYGKSSPSRFLRRDALMEDTRAAWDAMRARPDVDASRTGVLGVSLGGAFAVQLAVERGEQVRALCTVSAFSSFADIANDKVPLLGGMLVGDGLPARKSAHRVVAPWLIVHGQSDEIIPVAHAGVLAQAQQRATTLLVPNADHNGLMEFDQSKQGTIDFYRDALTSRSGPASAPGEQPLPPASRSR